MKHVVTEEYVRSDRYAIILNIAVFFAVCESSVFKMKSFFNHVFATFGGPNPG